jgi:glycosidase
MDNWIHSANIYHIYSLNFCGAKKFRKDFIGTEKGRILKVLDWIPHIKESNFNAVLFAPIFESVEHGYDTADYYKIDARLGTNEDFKTVADALHKEGIRIILDGVFNHVGRDFRGFADLREKGQGSEYKDWFAGVNFGGRSPYGDDFSYEGWSGHYNLVKLNLYNDSVVNHIFEAVKMWRNEWGIDGIRFDAADCLTDDFIKRFRRFAKSSFGEDFWLMGEIIHGNYARWANPEMFDSVTNYQCHKGIYSSHNDKNYFEIAHNIDQQRSQYGNSLYLYNFVDNHDVQRIATALRDYSHIKNVYTMLYTLYGVPSVYYGSEFGIKGAKGVGEDADLPLRPNLDINSIPDKDDELAAHITKLGEIRKRLPAIQTGFYDRVYLNNRTLVYKRELSGTVAYVALNIDDNPYTFSIKSTTEYWVDCLTGKKFKSFNGEVKIELPVNSSGIYVEEHIYRNAFNDEIIEEIIEIEAEAIEETIEEMSVEITPQLESEPAVRTSDIIPLGVKNNRRINVGGKYHHFKGNDYRVLAVARDHETTEEQVVYIALYDAGEIWVRPIENFLEEVDDHGNIKERFAEIE